MDKRSASNISLCLLGFPGGASGKKKTKKTPPANAGDTRDKVPSLSREDPLKKSLVTHSSILPRRIPWTEEPSGIQSMRSQRVGDNLK